MTSAPVVLVWRRRPGLIGTRTTLCYSKARWMTWATLTAGPQCMEPTIRPALGPGARPMTITQAMLELTGSTTQRLPTLHQIMGPLSAGSDMGLVGKGHLV